MIQTRKFILGLLLLMMTACASAPQLYRQQLVQLDKGMSSTQAISALQQPPLATYEASVDGVQFTFYQYAINNGRLRDVYLLCFEREKLKYWGYIEEFRRYPDVRINKAMEDVLIQIRNKN